MNAATEDGGANSTPHKVKVVSPYLSDSAGTGTSQDNEEQQRRSRKNVEKRFLGFSCSSSIDFIPHQEKWLKAVAASSLANRQQRQQRVYNMMKDLQQKHLATLLQGEMSERENNDMQESQNICRICHSLGDEPLITPCHCSGSAKHVHATCLLTWFKKAVKNTCELCRHKVAIKKKGRPYSEWRKPEDRPIPIIWFTVFLVGLFLNVFAIAVNASALCYTTPCVIFYVVNGFGVILDAAFLYFWWTKCLFFWRKWCALNQDWSIVIGPGQLAPQRTNQDERNGDRTTTSCIQMPHIV